MKNPRQTLRAFLLAMSGVALGIGLAKLSGGSLALVIALALAVGCFALVRLRDR